MWTMGVYELLGGPRRLNLWEVADHEEQVGEPECEPNRSDGNKPNREKDQARNQEQQGVTEQPEAVASPGMQRLLGFTYPAAKRRPVVLERREHE